ncbi:hypothetical protein BDN70DRAFT_562380 [Pholiota conissans]|uniref:Uncharacterized protein n=1 Tax=Pholiota conissans TaxID=109636 RepID=A0A9P5YKK5_9AGAR|nr:hypothetical protein BDN70DRAFT_562380 [Pholiota conissans]
MLTSRIVHNISGHFEKVDFRLPFRSCFLRPKELASSHVEYTPRLSNYFNSGRYTPRKCQIAIEITYLTTYFTFYHRTSILFNMLLSMPARHFSAGQWNFEQRPVALANRRCYSTCRDWTLRARIYALFDIFYAWRVLKEVQNNVEDYLEAPVMHSQVSGAPIVSDILVEAFRNRTSDEKI